MGFTTGAILATSAVVGAGLQAYGQYRAAQDKASAEEYNARIARQEADIAKQKGKLEVDRQRRYNKRFLAQTEVNIAKSGVAFSGSSLEVWKDNAEELELDALILQYNSQVEESRALSEAGERERNADRIRFTGKVQAVSTVLQQSASFLASQGTLKSGSGGLSQSEILGFDTRRYS